MTNIHKKSNQNTERQFQEYKRRRKHIHFEKYQMKRFLKM